MSVAGVDVDVLCREAIEDPQGYFGRLRAQQPVAWSARQRSWVVTSHEHVQAALKDARFSSDRIAPFIERKLSGPETDPLVRAAFEVLRDWLVFNDPPQHRRLRGLIHKAFAPRAVQGMQQRIEVLTDELLAAIPSTGELDINAAFCHPLPAILIAQMLGVPPEDRTRFKSWSGDVSAIVSAGLDDPDRYRRAAVGMGELSGYCAQLVAHHRREPADNLMTALLEAQEADETLSDAEVIATCTLVLFAGHETTTNFLANSLLVLLQRPAELARLRDGEVEPASAVEELLRFEGPGKAIVRVMKEDAELDGHPLRAGERVFLVIAAANRDPTVFEDPDELRLDRDPNPHVAFGHGFHFCLGASLARLEGAIALPRLLRALPDLALAGERPLSWQPIFLARALDELHVRVG